MPPAALARLRSTKAFATENEFFQKLLSDLETESDPLIRTTKKEAIVEPGLIFVKRLIPLLKENASALPKCAEWLQKIASIEDQAREGPRVFIGVIGSTGSGKSSLINALLDKSVVPSNCMRACTSVVVEIRFNDSTNTEEKYAADVHYITTQEWALEFETLKRDIMDDLEDDALGDDQSIEAKTASDKLKVIYPGMDVKKILGMTTEQLGKVRDLSTILGQTVMIRESTAKSFSQKINDIIGSTGEEDQAACWPFVQVVKVRLKAPILQNGLVLVDLPGQGDYNVARARVSESYIRKLNHIWVVAKIDRAVDESIARNLLGSNFKRQLLMEDKYNSDFLAFIATHIDNVDYNNVIQQQQGKDKLLTDVLNKQKQQKLALADCVKQRRALQNGLKKVNADIKSIKGLQGDVPSQTLHGKRKRNDMAEATDSINESSLHNPSSRLEIIQEQRKNMLEEKGTAVKREGELKANVETLRIQVMMECISARNRFMQNRLQHDFESGLTEYKQKVSQSRDGESSKVPVVTKGKDIRRCNLRTFCVSSTAYESLQKKKAWSKKPEAFPTLDSTQIPQLQNFAKQCTLARRERIASDLITQLGLMYVDIKASAESKNETHGLSEDQRVELLSLLIQKFKMHEQAIQQLQNDTKSELHLCTDELLSTLAKAVSRAPGKAAKLCERMKSQKLPPHTWKAICARNGVYNSSGKNQKRHNWQEYFASVILVPFTAAWDESVNKMIPKVLQRHRANVLEEFSIYADDIKDTVELICDPEYKPLQGILEQVSLLKNEANIHLSDIRKLGRKYAQEISIETTRLAAISLKPYTSKMSKETGKGVGKRMKDLLSDHIEKTSMYANMDQNIRNVLEKKKHELSHKLLETSMKASSKFHEDLEIMFKSPASQISDLDPSTLILKAKLSKEGQAIEKAWMNALQKPGWENEVVHPSIEPNSEGSEDSNSDGDGASDGGDDDGSDGGDGDEAEQKFKELGIIMQDLSKQTNSF